MKRLVAFLSLSLSTSFALAIDCFDPQTRTEQMICLSPDVSEADMALERTYTRTMRELEERCIGGPEVCDKIKMSLRKTQLSWITYRDHFCELETIHLDDLDESDFQYATCLVEVTKRKVEDLHIEQLKLRSLYRVQRARLDERMTLANP